jgi:hypothetical protein
MMRRPTLLLLSIAAIAAVVLPACSPDRESAETRIRTLLAEMETAAEAKELRPLKAVVSEQYTDALGNDHRAIVQLLMVHFLRNQSIHLLTRIAAIDIPEPGRASVTVYVAMAGRPIPDAAALAQLRANLYRFDFSLEELGERWQVAGAAWRPAEGRDFL